MDSYLSVNMCNCALQIALKEQIENLEIMLERMKLSHETDKQRKVSVIDQIAIPFCVCTCALHDMH